MKDIKIRVWDKVNKRMIYFSGLSWQEEYNLLYFSNGSLDVPVRDNLELMQYTGTKDKNGKEIYEGDIIKCYFRKHSDVPYGYEIHSQNYVIEYNTKKTRFEPEWYLDTYNWTTEQADILCGKHQVEVIGNIYENYNLLEKKIEDYRAIT